MNRAARRAEEKMSKERAERLLRFIQTEAKHKRTVDATTVAHPAEAGKICCSVEFQGAELNWNHSPDEITHSAELIVNQINTETTNPEEQRSFVRETILRTMRANQHLKYNKGIVVACCVAWMLKNSPQVWPHIESGRIKFAGYQISKKSKDDYNFRLFAGNTKQPDAM